MCAGIYYVEDLLGTSRIITNNTGVVCYDADFYPYGGERTPYTNNCPATNNYKFEGKERDTETLNDDFGARYYSNRFGRWLSADWSAVPVPVPYANLTNPQTLNFYAMVRDDPESFADLDGHDSFLDSLTRFFNTLFEPLTNARPNSEDGHKFQPHPPVMMDAHEVVAKSAEATGQGIEVMSNVVMLADITGIGGAAKSMMQGDNKGALIGAAFIMIPGGERIAVSEAKGLVGGWTKSTFESTAKSISYHFSEHGAEVGAKNVWQYLRKAEAFAGNLKGAKKTALEEGMTRYEKKGRYVILDKYKKIVSFGNVN